MRVGLSLLDRLDFRRRSALDALRAALLRRAPTFGPTYPRIIAAETRPGSSRLGHTAT